MADPVLKGAEPPRAHRGFANDVFKGISTLERLAVGLCDQARN